MDAISATIVAGGQARIQSNIGRYKYIDFYINLLILTKLFNSGLRKYMHKATCPSGGVDLLN